MSRYEQKGSERNFVGLFIGFSSLFWVFILLITSRTADSSLFQDGQEVVKYKQTLEDLKSPTPQKKITTGRFTKGNPLFYVLTKNFLSNQKAYLISRSLKKILSPKTLKASDQFTIIQDPDMAFQKLTITRSLKNYIVKESSGVLKAYTEDLQLTSQEHSITGKIDESLWLSMRGKGLSPQTIMNFVDIFSWNVDFVTEVRKNDLFSLIWEVRKTPDGKEVSSNILAANYKGSASGNQTAIRFKNDFYEPNGKSLRKAFLRAPLNFRRISSHFSKRRFHPILRYYRPHLGIDYAAPRGTPIVSVGDGKVVFKGRKGGYGRFVKIKHNKKYTSCYAHLAKYAKGLKHGQRIKQGQVIGYVGSSGLSTGPHLDFRITRNGKFVNFLKLKFPANKSIGSPDKLNFNELKTQRVQQLKNLLENPTILAQAP